MIECFFFVEHESESNGFVRSLCVECKTKMPKDFPAWFYSGQVGPWTVKCHKCEKIIYEVNNEASSPV